MIIDAGEVRRRATLHPARESGRAFREPHKTPQVRLREAFPTGIPRTKRHSTDIYCAAALDNGLVAEVDPGRSRKWPSPRWTGRPKNPAS